MRNSNLVQTVGAFAALSVGLLGVGQLTAERRTSSGAVDTVTSAAATSAGAASAGAAAAGAAAASYPEAVLRPSTFHLDRPPGGDPWQLHRCTDATSARHANGVLRLDAPGQDCVGYYLDAPHGIWNQWASNERGWVVEASVRVDPGSTGSCPHSTGANLYMHDDVHLLQVGISAEAVCLFYPEQVTVRRNTTVGFHAYRVEHRGRTVRVYVDGQLVIDRDLTVRGSGTRGLVFGDNNGVAQPGTSGSHRSYWDYVAYDTTPDFNPARWADSDWPPTVRRSSPTALPAG